MAQKINSLRIVTLYPGATEICIALGLQDCIVGRTHECPPVEDCEIVTASGLPQQQQTQKEIHKAVQSSCSRGKDAIQSLYPILEAKLIAARPTLIITQDLCGVCGPTSASVPSILVDARILSLSPQSLTQVIETFQTVADACNVSERGQRLCNDFQKGMETIRDIVKRHHTGEKPSMLLFEWLDPPFLAGHWISDMVEAAGIHNALPFVTSEPLPWSRVAQLDAHVVVVACCGRNLTTNIEDTIHVAKNFKRYCGRAATANQVFACNGDEYFVKPGPGLLTGIAILALTAFQSNPKIVQEIQSLAFVPDDSSLLWHRVNVLNAAATQEQKGNNMDATDIEDFDKIHRAACSRGDLTYKDPSTGYSVFTKVAHQQRGSCCGSGCRHCPFAHENVSDKANKIQQPAFLYRASPQSFFSLVNTVNLRILFFSGGKDSFLTIRALAREAMRGDAFGLILLTTFDASSRIIAHQDIPISNIVDQATHLDISLVGVPLHRGSSESYVERVQQGLGLIQNEIGVSRSNTRLVFGDLHLEHIKQWRDDQLGKLGYDLQYPLFNKRYSELEADLEASGVPCIVSSSTVSLVRVGDKFDKDFRQRLSDTDIDAFGENGEFHTIAQVWEVNRSTALGIHKNDSIANGQATQKQATGIKNGWFTETEAMWPGQKYSLALNGFSDESILFHRFSDFQEILVFESAQYGNVMVLDGVIQLTQKDEFAYHEVLVHLSLCSCRTPESVLVVGGGDGGALREIVTQYNTETVKRITVVEIDPLVVEVAKRFFDAAAYFDDPRVTIIHEDAAQYLESASITFDVILGDTSDPVGPAASLFQPDFYDSMYQHLNRDGVVCMQGECMWIHLDLISDLVTCCRDIFESAEYATTMVPTYPCGQIGFILARKTTKRSSANPVRSPRSQYKLKWYSPEMHRAAFVLPPFVAQRLQEDTDDEEQYRCFLQNGLTKLTRTNLMADRQSSEPDCWIFSRPANCVIQ